MKEDSPRPLVSNPQRATERGTRRCAQRVRQEHHVVRQPHGIEVVCLGPVAGFGRERLRHRVAIPDSSRRPEFAEVVVQQARYGRGVRPGVGAQERELLGDDLVHVGV
jgi:hypothetical protein